MNRPVKAIYIQLLSRSGVFEYYGDTLPKRIRGMENSVDSILDHWHMVKFWAPYNYICKYRANKNLWQKLKGTLLYRDIYDCDKEGLLEVW